MWTPLSFDIPTISFRLKMHLDSLPQGKPVHLRPYQEQAVADLEDRVGNGLRRIIIVAPTGSGKTTIAAHIIAKETNNGKRVLFMAHRRELINQAYNRLAQLGVPLNQIGVLMGKDRRGNPGAMVQVASVDTLRNRAKARADIVFVDEAHRNLAASYRNIAKCYPEALHLGLTATPFRANGEGLGDAYDDLLLVASPKQLIAEGHLVEPRVFTVPTDELPDLSSVRVSRGDYDVSALSQAVDSKALVGNIVEHWLRHAKGVRTIAFAVSVAHSQHIAEEFRNAGIAAEHLDGSTATEERDAVLNRLKSGETEIVSNCGILCEGFDLPAVKCAILARPTRSTGLYLQQAGRILRPWNNQQAIILDHGGCALEHGLPHDDRVFSLEGKKKKTKEKTGNLVRVCPECQAIVPLATTICPECGTTLIKEKKELEHKDGDLVEVNSEDLKQIELQRLKAIAAQRGYKPGWVYYRYKEKYGEAPPRENTPKAHRPPNQPTLGELLRTAAKSGTPLSWDKVTQAAKRSSGSA